MPIQNVIGALPGMDRATAKLMEKRIADNNVASVEELVQASRQRR